MRLLSGILCLAGCDGESGGTADASMPVDAPRPMRDAGPPPVDPALFDCTASGPPARVTPVPITCAADGACTTRMASSHRGAGAPGVLAPEDTLSAIRAAIAAGADLVEIDVRPTSDGLLVLMHDDDVSRTTSGSGVVSAMTLTEVQALALDTDRYRGDFSCERVPTFREALDLAQGRVHLIVDGDKTDRVDLVVADIVAASAVDWVIYDGNDPDKLEEALALEPALQIQIRATDTAMLDERLTRFAAHPPVWVHIEEADPATMVPRVDAAGLRVFALGFTSDILAGISGPTEYQSLYDAGIDVVQTNRIDLLADFLGR